MSLPLPLPLSDAIHQRRSVKSFKPDAIPAEILEQVITLTLAAPSSFNLQPWRIVVVDDPAQKEALAEVCWKQKQITQAPAVFVFAVDLKGWEKTLPATFDEARRLGAWPEKVIEFFGGAIPGFQHGLEANGLIREYTIKDALIAATHTALAAESLGLGSCFMNGWTEDGVKKVIGAEGNPDIAIALVLPVGYPAEVPKFSGRLPASQTVFKNRLS
ncbi:Nitroreductase [Verrucomicrobium sp. GAS474]|uniref:nitroreductase family protein n=1 Tax=Verrucomicrobium sp. GAS474 TaxID=1882831 RepID=UPI000879EF1D|nr:nitroreductase family protein [Verrucomicrobium sp. GAS474]SDU15367.1 Nitroreductase [Verrucomicrobium sp. GAS474]